MHGTLEVQAFDEVLVRKLLEHAEDYPWRVADIGLLALRLDERGECALHVWAPHLLAGAPPVHDHPYAFTSTIIAGELTNARYVEDPAGATFVRERYVPGDEATRVADHVRLVSTTATYRQGDAYAQLAPELHDSHQLPGTVTLLRRAFHQVSRLTVCHLEGEPWIHGAARDATSSEIAAITALALAWF